jgi:hypothetical protein
MDEEMELKEVNDYNSLPGALEEVPYVLLVMKDSGHMMKIMSTYGSLLVKDGQKDTVRNYKNAAGQNMTKKLKYTKPFTNHFLCRHCIDDPSNIRYSDLSIEQQTLRTHRWVNCIFTFLPAISKVNALLAFRFSSCGIPRTMLNCRNNLIDLKEES